MSIDGAKEIATYLKDVPLIKTLRIRLRIDDRAKVERALEPLLEIRDVKKARCTFEKEGPFSWYTACYWQAPMVIVDYVRVGEENFRRWEKVLETKTQRAALA